MFFSTSWSMNLSQWHYTGMVHLHDALTSLFLSTKFAWGTLLELKIIFILHKTKALPIKHAPWSQLKISQLCQEPRSGDDLEPQRESSSQRQTIELSSFLGCTLYSDWGALAHPHSPLLDRGQIPCAAHAWSSSPWGPSFTSPFWGRKTRFTCWRQTKV